jgi:hypothetical protein
MQFTTLLLSTLATLAAASPVAPRAETVSMMAAASTWTIQSMQRTCSSDDTSCSWNFGINTNDGTAVQSCSFTVTAQGTTPASQVGSTGATCGVYTVTSGWSGVFGPGNGFTTLSVINYGARLIVFPAYADWEVQSGAVVVPDKSYTPQSL